MQPEFTNAGLCCVIGVACFLVILLLGIHFLHSCHEREMARLHFHLRELTEENNRLKAEPKYEVILREAKPVREAGPMLPYMREE